MGSHLATFLNYICHEQCWEAIFRSGKAKDSEKLYQRALEGSEKTLGIYYKFINTEYDRRNTFLLYKFKSGIFIL